MKTQKYAEWQNTIEVYPKQRVRPASPLPPTKNKTQKYAQKGREHRPSTSFVVLLFSFEQVGISIAPIKHPTDSNEIKVISKQPQNFEEYFQVF